MATSNEVSNFFVAESVVRNTPNYDGLDILPLRSEIAFDSTNIRFYLLGIHHQLQIWSVRIYHSKWRIYKATCSSIPSNFRAGYAFKSILDTWREPRHGLDIHTMGQTSGMVDQFQHRQVERLIAVNGFKWRVLWSLI